MSGQDRTAARIPPGIKGVNVVQENAPVEGVPEPGGLPAASSAARTYGPLARNRSLIARLRWWLLPRVGYYCDGTEMWRWHMRVARWAWVAAGWLPGSRLYD